MAKKFAPRLARIEHRMTTTSLRTLELGNLDQRVLDAFLESTANRDDELMANWSIGD